MNRRLLSLLSGVLLLALCSPSFSETPVLRKATMINGTGTISGTTFFAPLDDPSNPLRISTGTGAFTFTRASIATFVHPTTGLITRAGNNEFLYSEQQDNAYWVTASNTTISADTTIAPDGNKTADSVLESSATATIHRHGVTGTTFGNGARTWSFYIKYLGRQWIVAYAYDGTGWNGSFFDIVNGVKGVNAGGDSSDWSISDEGDGWFRISCPHTILASGQAYVIGTAISDGDEILDGDTSKGYYIWGHQNETGSSATWYSKTVAAATGALRIESAGALIEGQRTNLALHSEDLGTTWGTANVTISTNTDTSPDGNTTADRIISDSTPGVTHAVYQSGIVTADSVSVTASGFFKQGSGSFGRWVDLCVVDRAGSYRHAWFDLQTGTAGTLAGGGITSKIEDYGNGWYRCSIEVADVGISVGDNAYVFIFMSEDDGDYTFDGDGSSYILAWGLGFEVGSFASSYIPTGAAAVTRNADALTVPSSGNIDGTVGTIYLEGNTDIPMGLAGFGSHADFIDVGSVALALSRYYSNGSLYSTDGTSTLQSYAGQWSNANTHKAIVRWDDGDSLFKNTLDGETPLEGAFDGDMNVTATMTIGSRDSGTYIIYGHIKNLRIWDRALTDAEMIALTNWYAMFDGLTFFAPFDDPDNPFAIDVGTGSFTFARATTATYLHPTTGLITTAASGEARIESNGILIEGQRTNHYLNSSDIYQSVDHNTPSAVQNYGTSPDGTQTSTLLADNMAGDYEGKVQSISGITADTNAKTFSFFAKAGTLNKVLVYFTMGTKSYGVTFNLDTGAVIRSTGIAANTPEAFGSKDYGNGWWMLWASGLNDNATSVACYVLLGDLVTDEGTVEVWGAQLEEASFPSSYIPTTTVAVTRNADVLTFPVSGNIADSAGTVILEAYIDRTNDVNAYFISGGSGASLMYETNAPTLAYYDGTNAFSFEALTVDATNKIGIKWSTATSKVLMAHDGTLDVERNYDGSWNFAATTSVGSSILGGGERFGCVKNLRIWNRALTGPEMQAITE